MPDSKIIKEAMEQLVDARLSLLSLEREASSRTFITREEVGRAMGIIQDVINQATIIYLKVKWNLKEEDKKNEEREGREEKTVPEIVNLLEEQMGGVKAEGKQSL